MTNDERIGINNKCAELYGVGAYIPIFVSSCTYEKKTYLIDDWSRLMPLAVEHEVNMSHGFGTMAEAWFNDTGNDTFEHQFTEHYKDHPTKAHAVQAAIVKALIAKKESQK